MGSVIKIWVFLITINQCLLAAETIILKRQFDRGDGHYIAPGLHSIQQRAPKGEIVIQKSDGQYVVPPRYYVSTVSEYEGVKPDEFVILYRKISTFDDGKFEIYPGLRQVVGVGADGTIVLRDRTDERPVDYVARRRDYVPAVEELNRMKVGDFALLATKTIINQGNVGFNINPGSWPIVAIGKNGDIVLRDPADSQVVDYIITRKHYQPLHSNLAESNPDLLNARLFVFSKRRFWGTRVPIPVVAVRAEGKDIGVVRASDFLDSLGRRNSLNVYKIGDSEILRMDSSEDYGSLLERDRKSTEKMPGLELQQLFIPPTLEKTPAGVLNFVNSQFNSDCTAMFGRSVP